MPLLLKFIYTLLFSTYRFIHSHYLLLYLFDVHQREVAGTSVLHNSATSSFIGGMEASRTSLLLDLKIRDVCLLS